MVEDEISVRSLIARTLIEQGYTVLEAANGSEALHLVREDAGQDIQLLLTDVIMPQVGGMALVSQLRTDFPDVKVLYISGYTGDTILHNEILDTNTAFLAKPFTPDELARKVRSVLDRN